MDYNIDRFEGEFAILQDKNKQIFEVDISLLPHGVKEGDLLNKLGDHYIFNPDATSNAKRKIDNLIDDVFSK